MNCILINYETERQGKSKINYALNEMSITNFFSVCQTPARYDKPLAF